MKLLCPVVILIILTFTPDYYSQGYPLPGDYSNTSNYAETPMQNGLPEIEPGREYSLKIKNPSFAWINPVGEFSQIYFIKGNETGNKEKFWILTVSSVSGNSLIPVTIINRNADINYGYAVITENLSISFSFKLELIYSNLGNVLKYSWPSDINSVLGNNGIIIPFIKTGSEINIMQLPFLNQIINRKSFNNKTIILNWILTSAATGKNSFSDFNSLYDKYGGNNNLVFISVGADKNYVNNAGNYILLKADSSASSFPGGIYPLNIIIDTSGKVTFSRAGYNKSVLNNIDKILAGYQTK